MSNCKNWDKSVKNNRIVRREERDWLIGTIWGWYDEWTNPNKRLAECPFCKADLNYKGCNNNIEADTHD